MKRYIKHGDLCDEWQCTKCGLYFTLMGPQRCYIRPNFCPNCGIPYSNGEPNEFTRFEEDEEYDTYKKTRNN